MDSCLTSIPELIKQRILGGLVLAPVLVFIATDTWAQTSRAHNQRIPDFYGQYVRRENVGTSARAQLRNGLRVIVEEYASRPISAVTMVVGTGYADEKVTEFGAASALAWWLTHRGDLSEKITLKGGVLGTEVAASIVPYFRRQTCWRD